MRSMRYVALILAAAFTLSIAPNGHAHGGLIGNDLKPSCDAFARENAAQQGGKTEALRTGHCLGYVEGVIEGTLVTSILTNQGAYPYCLPAGSTSLQEVNVVAKYMNDHPEHLHWPAGLIINTALKSAFPCPGK